MGALDNRKAITKELGIVNHPATLEEAPVLVDLVGQLHAAAGVAELSALHARLLARYLARQRVRDDLEIEKANTRSRIVALSTQAPRRVEQIRSEQALLARIDSLAAVQVALAAHTRAITDGLVWKALGYDRAAITVLARGTRVDRLADDGVGLEAELQALALFAEQEDVVTIHNDVSTVLRHGDLTTINPALRSVQISEVKASSAIDESQAARGRAAIRLINDGEAIDPRTGRLVRLHRLAVKSRTFLNDLTEVIEESRTDGYSHRLLGSMQHLTVIDYSAWAGREEQLAARDAAVKQSLGWGLEHKTFEWLASLRRIRDRRTTFGSLAPLTIFPLDPSEIVNVMLGRLEIRTMLRGDLLEAAFACRGLAAEVEFADDRDSVFLRVRRGSLALDVPPDLREQMLFELLTPDTAIDTVVAMLDLLLSHDQAKQDFLTSIDEAGVWA